MIIVDIFDITPQPRDTGIHLKVDEEPKSSRGPQKRNERQNLSLKVPLACSITSTNTKSTNKSLSKA